MKSNDHILTLAFVLFSSSIFAQNSIETILASIAKNNKSIQATAQYYEAQDLQYKTGLTPTNPTAEYDFLSGSPSSAGNQTEFTFAQQFDFPSAYIKKKQLAKAQVQTSAHQITAAKQDILLDAKKVCIAIIYHNRLQQHLNRQKLNAEKLLSDFQSKLDKGDGNILDVNKARLQLITFKKEFNENTSAINELSIKLTELNGGNGISLTDTIYPVAPIVPPFAQLESDYEQADPLLKILQQKQLITQKELELSKALWLPKMEVGYHYQGFLNQNFNGIHTGISIPLWEKRNTVKQKRAQLQFSNLELNAHTNEHFYHIKHIYERYSNLSATLTEYQNVMATLNNTALLDKALTLGQISSIEYFYETSFFNNAIINYLQTEKEYFTTIAELYKYQL